MSQSVSLDKFDPSVRVLMEAGKKHGFLTYEEMNQILPRDVENIDEILAVPGLTSLAFGPMDLSASLGHRGQPSHPDVQSAVRHVVERAGAAGIPTGVSIGSAPETVCQWADLGVDWVCYGVDVTLMIQTFNDVAGKVRDHVAEK